MDYTYISLPWNFPIFFDDRGPWTVDRGMNFYLFFNGQHITIRRRTGDFCGNRPQQNFVGTSKSYCIGTGRKIIVLR